MRGFTRRNIIALVVGVLLAGVLFVAFDHWLSGFIDRQAQAEIAIGGERAVALAETRLGQAVTALDAATKASVRSCDPAAVTTMWQAAFDAAPVKSVMLLGPTTQVLCSSMDMPFGDLRLVSSRALPGKGGLSLDVMRAAGGAIMIRLRRKIAADGYEIAALVPAKLLLPQASVAGKRGSAFVTLIGDGGEILGTAGARPRPGEPRLSFKARSTRFGLAYDIVVPRALVPATHSGILWFGKIALAAMLLVLGALALLVRWRTSANPVVEMERALKAGEFVPYYQPIVDITTGQLRGAEVLVRWRKADGTLVLPGSFIPLAESSGLVRPMMRDLMLRVRREAGDAVGRRPALKISFNVAGSLFSDPSIVEDVRKAFAGGSIGFSQVVLEVTERDPIQDFTQARQTIAALQGLGVRIAIDDVGTGHSGLSYVLKLGVDIIKIDKMFVDSIGKDRNATTIVETLVDLANNMRMDVVAEGVETFEQVVHLRERGIRQAQGYVFAPPLPGRSFLELIEAVDPSSRQEGKTQAAAAPARSAPRPAEAVA